MEIRIGKRRIGKGCPVFIIAELSANHGGKFQLAAKSIAAIKEAGADAVKVQTYTPDTITFDGPQKCFRIKQGTIWDGRSLYDLYKEAYMPWEWQPKLKTIAEKLGLVFFSSPFDPSAVDFLEKMKVPAYKIASYEITDIPLIEYIAAKKKPVIISTGIARAQDIREAIRACKKMGNDKIILLKCTSAYPAPLEEINLRTIPDLEKRFKVLAGLSDHTIGIATAVASVALGCKVIEKHFILDRKQGGPDSSFSSEPNEFCAMVQAVRDVERSLGEVSYQLSKKAQKARELSRSLFVVKDLKAGERLTSDNVRSLRPACGLAPKFLKSVMRKQARVNIARGTPLKWNLIK